MIHQKNKDLTKLNTFGIEQFCDNFFEIENSIELKSVDFDNETLILGGGSNILITQRFKNVVHLKNTKIEILEKNSQSVLIKADAGVIWDDLVQFCVDNDFYGIENLSYIPGTVGASPIQNIGAYGAEAKDVIESVEFYNINEKSFLILDNNLCQFAYRSSIFKTLLKSNVVVSSVIFRLSNKKLFNLNYADLQIIQNKPNLTLSDVRNEIIEIRKRKLPNPSEIGNTGSFFKNAIVDENKFNELFEKYPQIPNFKTVEGVKIPTAWLIENTGLKGYRINNCGIYPKHSLVLVNYGNSTAADILSLANFIEQKVFENFGILIEKEVNIF